MKKTTIIIGVGAAIAVALAVYFILEMRKRKTAIKSLSRENTALKSIISDLTKEVNEIIESKEELSESVKNQLKELIDEYRDIDEKVTDELVSVSLLIEAKEETKAIMVLAKIIENLLKKIYRGDSTLKSNPKFVDLINHAEKQKLLEKEEYHFLNGVREIRNKEAHELSVKKGYNIIASSILTGFSIIFKLSSVLRDF